MSFDKYGDLVRIKSKKIHDLLIFKYSVNIDERGTIFTTYLKEILDPYLPNNLQFNHDKFSLSKKNVLRGLHGDNKTWKLVTCIYGEIFQVVVDCRPDSKSYLSWESFNISEKNRILVLIPPNFANGFSVISEEALYHYKLAYLGEYNDTNDQFIIKYNDGRLKIPWPNKKFITSMRDN